jgi:hypothetical protein
MVEESDECRVGSGFVLYWRKILQYIDRVDCVTLERSQAVAPSLLKRARLSGQWSESDYDVPTELLSAAS